MVGRWYVSWIMSIAVVFTLMGSPTTSFWDLKTVMDWGMLRNPAVAAEVCCSPVSDLSNGNELCLKVPTRNRMEHRPGVRQSPAPYSCWHSLLRTRLGFGVGMSVLILVADAILRLSWVLGFSQKLFPSDYAFVLCSEFLEIVRRALWNLLRMEWEELKQSGQQISAPIRDELLLVP